MEKRKITGALLILTAAVFFGYAVYEGAGQEPEEKVQEEAEIREEAEAREGAGSEQEEAPVPERGSREPEFEIRAISEEYLRILDIDEAALADLIYAWTKENRDYALAEGVELYGECIISAAEGRCSLPMKTITEQPEESRVLVLDYYKESQEYLIHP